MSKKDIEPFGSYLLLEKLAMGGMAEIFLSKSAGAHGIGKFVAIKRILPQYSANEEFIKMFTEEAKLCMNLSHSNIAKIHEFGVQNSQFYIAMELITGRNLRQILSRLNKEGRPGLAVDQCAFIAKEIAAGLDYAHRCLDNSSGKPLNIIHRDMSPQNVMISFDGEVKVVDFGIAKADKDEGEATKAGTLKGKFSYMSPEQAGGEALDIRTDVFSLGIVLWEILANKRLFASNNEMTTLKKIRECKIPPISKINPKVPEELERIVNIALAKNADNRYQTCAEFYKDLNRFLNRFYPDFSSHDFSVYVKSLYADEVLNNRNKFIEYSKMSNEYKHQKDREEENKKTVEKEEVNDIFGDNMENSKITLNANSLRVESTSITNIKNRAELQRRENTASVVSFVKNKDLLTPANLTVVALFVVAIGLIVSQLIPSSSDEEIIEYALEQPSLTETTTAVVDSHSIVVTSSPSAAEIYIDGKNQGQLTPARVKVPANREFQISLKKDGYITRTLPMKSRGNGSKESFSLAKLDAGYLNIYSKHKETVIYLNGKKIKERTPLRNYRVPAGKTIRVKAIDLKTKRYTETSVEVKADESKTLKLNPRQSL
jgi:serine/threonine-protein kinase